MKRSILTLALTLSLLLGVAPAGAAAPDYSAYVGTWTCSGPISAVDGVEDISDASREVTLTISACDGKTLTYQYQQNDGWCVGMDTGFGSCDECSQSMSGVLEMTGNVASGQYSSYVYRRFYRAVEDGVYSGTIRLTLKNGSVSVQLPPTGTDLFDGSIGFQGTLQNPLYKETAPAAKPITVLVNSAPISFDQPPVALQGRILVPMRAVFEAMGVSVIWDGSINAVTRKDTVRMMQNYNDATVYEMYLNGERQTLDVPPMVLNNRTLVPLRAVAQAFGAKVNWLPDSQTVTIDGSIPAGERLEQAEVDKMQAFTRDAKSRLLGELGYQSVPTEGYDGYSQGKKYYAGYVCPQGAPVVNTDVAQFATVYYDGTYTIENQGTPQRDTFGTAFAPDQPLGKLLPGTEVFTVKGDPYRSESDFASPGPYDYATLYTGTNPRKVGGYLRFCSAPNFCRELNFHYDAAAKWPEDQVKTLLTELMQAAAAGAPIVSSAGKTTSQALAEELMTDYRAQKGTGRFEVNLSISHWGDGTVTIRTGFNSPAPGESQQ